MKSKPFYFALLLSFILSLFQFSCKSSERSALSCPEISVRKSNYAVSYRKSKSRNYAVHKSKNKKQVRTAVKNIREHESPNPSLVSVRHENTSPLNKTEYNKSLIASTENILTPSHKNSLLKFQPSEPDRTEGSEKSPRLITNNIESSFQDCDTIFLKSGGSLIGKVEEIGQNEIKYRRCSNLSGPVIVVLKTNVTSIHYSNGTRDYFDANDLYIPNPVPQKVTTQTQTVDTYVKNEGLGIAGFVSGLVGLFIASIPLGIIAVVFGAISLSKIKRNPGRIKGRGLAIAAIVLGIVDVVAMLVILGSLSLTP